MQLSFKSNHNKQIAILLLMGVSAAIASQILFLAPRTNSAWQYPFIRPEPGKITKTIQQEISFYQQRIQQQPTSGLERAALAQAYLKMARATGESSWYLLAERTAQQSIEKLPIDNHGAMLVLAKVAAAKHDFTRALLLLEKLPPQPETLALKATTQLAIGDVKTASKTADILAQKMPTTGNLTLKALVAFAQGDDNIALQNFQAAIMAEEPEEAGSSAWVRTLLGRLYYKRGQLDRAEELYRSALQILPQYPPALLNLAELSVRRWQADPSQSEYQQQAVEIYDRFFLTNQKAPTTYDHVALRGLARVRKLQGNTPAASQIWERAVTRLRADLTGFGHRRELAQLLLDRGRQSDLSEALTLMQAEINIRKDPETWDTLAAVYLQMGRIEAAQQAIDMALKSGIRDPGLIDRAVVITAASGRSSPAQKYRELLKNIDPQFDAGARQALGLGVGLSGLN